VLSDLVSQKKWDSVLRVLFTSVRAHCIVVIPAVILCAASPWIMQVYGAGFSSGSITMCIMVTSAVFVTLHTPIWPVLIAANKVYPLLLMNIGWGLFFIIGTRLLLPFGSIGLASAQLIAYICHFTWMFIYTWKLLSRLYLARAQRPVPLSESMPSTASLK
jgi:O-antigen/teichoic acid export membrane protein